MATGVLPRGKQVRSDKVAQAANRFAQTLKRMGFDVTDHFPFRWGQRAIEKGLKAGPDKFANWFATGKHFKDGRDNQNVSIVQTPVGPVVYRLAGPRGNNVRIITFVKGDRLPPGAEPMRAPRLVGGRVVR